MKGKSKIPFKIIRDLDLSRLIEFVEGTGIHFKYDVNDSPNHISVSFTERSGEELKKVFLKFKDAILRRIILDHPDCPKELKIVEAL